MGAPFTVIFLELALCFVATFGNVLVEIVSRPGGRYRMLRNADNKFCSNPSLFLVYDDFAIDNFITYFSNLPKDQTIRSFVSINIFS